MTWPSASRINTMVSRLLRANPGPALLVVLGASFLLNVVGMWWGVRAGNVLGWDVDAIAPIYVIESIAGSFRESWPVRYPPLHGYLLAVLYSPLFLLHKLGWINILSYPYYELLVLAGRALSVVMATGVIYTVYLCGRELQFSKTAAVLAATLAALTSNLVYYGKTLNLDVPYSFWFGVSLFFMIRCLRTPTYLAYVLLATSAVFAVTTKDQAFALYVLVVPYLGFASYRHFRQDGQPPEAAVRAVARRLGLAGGVASILFILIHVIAFGPSGSVEHFREITGPATVPYRMVDNTLEGQARLLGISVRSVIYMMGWPSFIVCALGICGALFRFRKARHELPLLLVIVSYYIFFIATIGYTADRFFLPISLILALFGGRFLAAFVERGFPLRKLRIAAAAILLAFSLLYAVSVDLLILYDSRNSVHRWMRQNADRSMRVGAVGIPPYLPVTAEWATIQTVAPSRAWAEEHRFDYIVLTSAFGMNRFPEGSQGRQFFRDLENGDLGYREALAYQGRPPFNFLHRKIQPETNLNKINPKIRVFRNLTASTSSPK